MKEETYFDKEVVSSTVRISKEIISYMELNVGHSQDDFIQNTLTAKLDAYFYSQMSEQKELVYYCDKPSFLDWLFGRKKRVVFNLDVKDILLNPPKIENTERIYITYEKETKP